MGTTLTNTGITFNDATVQTTAAAVKSVNGNTGAITAAQIASAATAGYGYTPANPANFISSTVLGTNNVGCIVVCYGDLGAQLNVGSLYSTSSGCIYVSGGYYLYPGFSVGGTWKCVASSNWPGTWAQLTLFIRIA